MLPADAGLLEQRWPRSGAVRFAAVAMAYRPGLPLVLEQVSFALAGGVKAAVVGRSGAGKSSLTVALLRLVPLAAGAICIDGVDIASVGPATNRYAARAATACAHRTCIHCGLTSPHLTAFHGRTLLRLQLCALQVGLRALRRAMTFIQQDAVLFAGSLRANLDPFGEYSDEALEAALAQAAPLALLLAVLLAPCSQPLLPAQLVAQPVALDPSPGPQNRHLASHHRRPHPHTPSPLRLTPSPSLHPPTTTLTPTSPPP